MTYSGRTGHHVLQRNWWLRHLLESGMAHGQPESRIEDGRRDRGPHRDHFARVNAGAGGDLAGASNAQAAGTWLAQDVTRSHAGINRRAHATCARRATRRRTSVRPPERRTRERRADTSQVVGG